MQRRKLLKNLSTAMFGAAALPAWANNWQQSVFTNSLFFTESETNLLGEIVETIIPETDTPGAKSLGVHKLIQKIITDCYGLAAEQKLSGNLKKLESHCQSTNSSLFSSLLTDKKLVFFKSLEQSQDSDLASFYSQMKRLTIDGYLKSEYVMTNITNYEYAPGRWNGCVNV